MKKYTSIICTMAVLLMAAAVTFVSCAKDEEPAVSGKTYTMTVNASKGAPATKDLSLDGTTLTASWKAGEEVTVYNESKSAALTGTLVAQSDGSSTTLKGELTGTIEPDDVLTLKFCSNSYNSQDGTLEYIAANCDYATATVTVATVADGNITTTADAAFVNQQAIVKFTLQQSDHSALPSNPTALTINYGTGSVTLTDIPAATYTTNGDGVLYVSIPGFSNQSVTLSATVGDYTYTKTVSNITFVNGQYYTVTVGMTLPACSYTAPTLVSGTLTYNGSAQSLVTGGSATNATIYYSTNGGSSWSTSVPTGTNAGNYTVYYKVVPDDGYTGGVESTSLGSKTINKANGWVSLSSTSSSGWLTSLGKSVSVTVNNHGGSLSSSKSGGGGSQNLSVNFSGNTMTLSIGSGIGKGCYDVTVTVYSAATQNYNAASATYFCGQ